MVTLPGETGVIVPELLMVATAVLLLLHVPLIESVYPLQSVALLVNPIDPPIGHTKPGPGTLAKLLNAQQLIQLVPHVAVITLKMPPEITAVNRLSPPLALANEALPSSISGDMTLPFVSACPRDIKSFMPISAEPLASRWSGKTYLPSPFPK